VIVDNAILQDAVFYGAVLKENNIVQVAVFHMRIFPYDNCTVALCSLKTRCPLYEYSLSYEGFGGFQVGFERTDVEPGFFKREAVHWFSLSEEFLKYAANIIRVVSGMVHEQRNGGSRQEGAAGTDK